VRGLKKRIIKEAVPRGSGSERDRERDKNCQVGESKGEGRREPKEVAKPAWATKGKNVGEKRVLEEGRQKGKA